MPEQHNIEYKLKWKDDYLAWLCGFANAQGGKLYLGIDDNGQVVGLPNPSKLLEDIPNKIRDAMGILCDVNLRHENGKDYIEIEVPAYPIAISYRGAYYYRSGSTNQILTGPELERFILRRRGVTWDALPLPGFTLDDVNDGAVKRFKQWAVTKGRIDEGVLRESKEGLMERLHLVSNGYLTNAAMLLFSDDPERWQLGAYTKVGFFETDADLVYQDEIHGSLLEQIDKIIEIVHLKYMKAQITYQGMQRVERYFVPGAALREALLNALCHKDYSMGIPIQISVYEDRLYIGNCGCLPENWTVDNLMGKHVSKPYNPNIAHVFYLAGFIESWGRGIEKICSACRMDGSPLPEYTVHPGDIMVKFSAAPGRAVRSVPKKGTETGTENGTGTKNGTKNRKAKATEQETEILTYLTEDPAYTYKDLAAKTGLGHKVIATRINSLKEQGVLIRIGTARKGYWRINRA